MSCYRRGIILLTTAALTGCFSEVPSKAGASEAELERDYRECRAVAVERAPQQLNPQTGQLEPDAYTVTRDQRRCMQARGWHYAPAW
jgi:hypothetical protein